MTFIVIESFENKGHFVVWIVVGLCVLIVFLAIKHLIDRKKRNDAIRKVAASIGFNYSFKKSIPDSFKCFGIYSEGSSHTGYNCITGMLDNLKVALMDFHYTITGSESTSDKTYRQTVLILDTGEKKLPPFEIFPQTIFQKLKTKVGYQDINFRSHPVFSERYVVQGYYEDDIRKSMTEQFLSSMETQTGLRIQCTGTKVIFYRKKYLLKADEIEFFIDWGLQRINELEGRI